MTTLLNTNNTEINYGADYSNHILEQYKIYLEMTDRISSRRQNANSFFLTINTTLLTLSGYINISANTATNNSLTCLISLCGIILCYTWYRLIKSYKDLNTGKFLVIHEIEKLLPLSPYDYEWELLGKGKDKKKYLPFTNIENFIPWTFLVVHLTILINLWL